MKRPADQAKLLFFYLLRSSASALANNANGGGAANNAAAAGHICLRLARRTDVPSIQRCNLATLPENYNAQFYTTHLRQWPDLALVAEHVMPNTKSNMHLNTFPGASSGSNPEPKIVGYVLGKVEDHSFQFDPAQEPHHDSTRTYQDLGGRWNRLEATGHVTSLAVLHEYRRKGVAAALMNQLHAHLEQAHGVSAVGLHVRKGNEAATSLYQRYGYNVERVLEHYYADGEQAYFMKKPLESTAEETDHSSRYLRFGRPKPWQSKNGPFSLPRIIWRQEEKSDASTVIVEEQQEVQVMTGT
jgi:ribosomal protein S18 acetylase RimI-like enzyme